MKGDTRGDGPTMASQLAQSEDEDLTWKQLVYMVLISYQRYIVWGIGIIGLIIIVSLDVWSQIGQFWQLTTVLGILIGPAMYVWVDGIVKAYLAKDRIHVFEVNALKFSVRHWGVRREFWEQRKVVVNGRLYSGESMGRHNMIIARDVEFVKDSDGDKWIRLKGPWFGESDDVEMMTAKAEIRETRDKFRDWARIGQILYASYVIQMQRIENRYSRQVMQEKANVEYEDGAETIDEALPEQAKQLMDSIGLPSEEDSPLERLQDADSPEEAAEIAREELDDPDILDEIESFDDDSG